MNKKALYLLAFAHLCCDLGPGALPAALPFLATAYNLAYTDVAGLMFASSFLSSFIQPIFGHIADRTEKGFLIGSGVLVSLVSFALLGSFSDYGLLFAAITAMGIGSAAFHPEAVRLVNVLSASRPGAGVSIFSVGGNAGFGIGPLLAVFFISTWGLSGLQFFGALGLLMGIGLLFIVPKLKASAQKLLVEKQDIAGKSGGLTNDWSSFCRLTVVIMLRSVVICGLSGFLPLFCIRELGATTAAGSSTLSAFAAIGIFTTLVGGRLADRIGYAHVLRYGCLAMVPILAAIVWGHQLMLVYALLLPLSCAIHGVYSSFVVLGQSYLARSIGFASGITMGLAFSVGGIVLPAIGWFADEYGLLRAMELLVLISAACAAASLLLREPKKAEG
ncbi:MAG: MFS transporter [Selenomonadaceae bacterium]|nr:MFS transporter [Selenomonadaceae bacterium]